MKQGVNYGYAIKATSGRDALYFDQENNGWTTLLFCTKFYLKKDAKRTKTKIKSDWMKDIKVVKVKTEEL